MKAVCALVVLVCVQLASSSTVAPPHAINAWGSSQYDDRFPPKDAWSGPKFFHSALEDNPWLRIQLNKPTEITSITFGNRKGCCGDRLKNLEIRAGMNNDMTNDVVGTFKGPGKTGEQYTIRLQRAVVAEFLTFQIRGKQQYLQIEGIRLNEQSAIAACVSTANNVQRKGCYSSLKKGQLLVYWRYRITWKNIGRFATDLACECSKVAKKVGAEYFGIHFWGECWALEKASLRMAPQGDCVVADGKYKTKCTTTWNGNWGSECLAHQSFFVYKVLGPNEEPEHEMIH